jgi:hypothetical protein
MTLLQLQSSLKAAGISRPKVDDVIHLLRSSGVYCPLDDRLYVPFTYSLLARRSGITNHLHDDSHQRASIEQQLQDSTSNSRGASTSKTGDAAAAGRPTVPHNSARMAGATLAEAASIGTTVATNLNAARRCIWAYTLADVSKGEEIVLAASRANDCDWPGMQQQQQQ